MQYALLGVVVVGLAVAIAQTSLRHRRTAALRKEAKGQAIAFQIRLDHVRVMGSGWTDLKGEMVLIVRADAFEVSATTPLLGTIFGMDYYFRAPDTTIEVSESPSFLKKRLWIVVSGKQGTSRTELAITSENHLYDAWAAFVRAGVVPIGSPPPIPST
jgi:hypothetical protein